MNKETITDKQGIILVAIFIIGTSSIQAIGVEAKEDLWLTILFGMLISLPIILVYARLYALFPEKDLFDVIEICFGKGIGKLLILLFTLYLLETASEVVRNFGEFIRIESLRKTPFMIPQVCMMILCVWVVKAGVEVIGRCSQIFIAIMIMATFIAFLLLLPNMDINNVRPTLYYGIKPIIKGGILALFFPFTQILPCIMAFSGFEKKESSYKVYIGGLCIGGCITLILSMMNILVLGTNEAANVYHPTYVSASRIDVGDFLQRLEIVSATIFSLGAFAKISIYLLAVCKGYAKLFEYKDYRFIVTPITILILNLSYFIIDNIMDLREFNALAWNYYAAIFQVILPVIILGLAEIRKKELKIKE